MEGVPMARMDRRLRVWAWLVRQQASIAGKSEAEVLALRRVRVR
jgi:hypothetical protein